MRMKGMLTWYSKSWQSVGCNVRVVEKREDVTANMEDEVAAMKRS